MKFSEIVDHARTLLQRTGKLTYRTLTREFALDEEMFEDLKDELIVARRVASDEGGKVLVWTGTRINGGTDKRTNGEKEVGSSQARVGNAHHEGTVTEAGTVGRAHPTAEDEAEACFLKAIAIAQKQQAKSLELRAVMSLARLWQQQGKSAEAHNLLSQVYNWFTEGFNTKDLRAAKALLVALT